jgi:hypothetical protein
VEAPAITNLQINRRLPGSLPLKEKLSASVTRICKIRLFAYSPYLRFDFMTAWTDFSAKLNSNRNYSAGVILSEARAKNLYEMGKTDANWRCMKIFRHFASQNDTSAE